MADCEGGDTETGWRSVGYTRAEFETALEGLSTRRVDAVPMITDVVSIDELPAAFAALAAPTTQGKVLLEF